MAVNTEREGSVSMSVQGQRETVIDPHLEKRVRLPLSTLQPQSELIAYRNRSFHGTENPIYGYGLSPPIQSSLSSKETLSSVSYKHSSSRTAPSTLLSHPDGWENEVGGLPSDSLRGWSHPISTDTKAQVCLGRVLGSLGELLVLGGVGVRGAAAHLGREWLFSLSG